jgi:hypothetical protein
MDTLTRLLEPRLLDLMVVAIAISYLLGEIQGEHAAAGPTDRDGEAPPPAALDLEKTIWSTRGDTEGAARPLPDRAARVLAAEPERRLAQTHVWRQGHDEEPPLEP